MVVLEVDCDLTSILIVAILASVTHHGLELGVRHVKLQGEIDRGGTCAPSEVSCLELVAIIVGACDVEVALDGWC